MPLLFYAFLHHFHPRACHSTYCFFCFLGNLAARGLRGALPLALALVVLALTFACMTPASLSWVLTTLLNSHNVCSKSERVTVTPLVLKYLFISQKKVNRPSVEG